MSSPTYGYAGKMLRVNLTTGEISEEKISQETLQKFVGGSGIGVKILYDEVSPSIDWSDPANKLIIASGPLGGTPFPGTGTLSFVTKGAMTNGVATSQANGLFGAYLRLSGYDGIILEGASPDWVSLNINDDSAELVNADHLHGLDTYETYEQVLKDIGKKEKEASTLSIGPAGEKLSRLAGIFESEGHSASKNGPGAVMGSKKLKAISVTRGSNKIPIKDPEKFNELAGFIREKSNVYQGTLGLLYKMQKRGDGAIPVKNYTTNIWDISDEKIEDWSEESIRERYSPKPNPCYGCAANHSTMMTIPCGPYAGMKVEEPEYEQMAAWGPIIDNDDMEAAAMLCVLTDRLGFDNNEIGWIVSWLMECYERELVSQEQLNGIDLAWGNIEATRELMYLIARREGIGDSLAEGVMRASQKLGGEAARAAIYTKKGNSPRGHDHRTRWGELLDTIVSNTGTLENHTSISALPPYSTAPGEAEKVTLGEARTKGVMILNDCLGNCRFPTGLDLALFTEVLNAITGWSLSQREAQDVGVRTVNMMKVYNLRAGIGRDKDAPSERYGSTPVDGPSAGISIQPDLEGMLRLYYTEMGWDPETSKPLPETLRQLGLDTIIQDIW